MASAGYICESCKRMSVRQTRIVYKASAITAQKPQATLLQIIQSIANCLFLYGDNPFSLWTGYVCPVDRSCKCRPLLFTWRHLLFA